MSEYWISNKKYFCRSCRIYIQDNKASRRLHEAGNSHKNAVAEELRNLYKRQDEQKIENQKNQQLLRKINDEAHKQYEKDLRKGLNKDTSLQEVQYEYTPDYHDSSSIRSQTRDNQMSVKDDIQDEEPEEEEEQDPRENMGIIGEWVAVDNSVSPQVFNVGQAKLFKKASKKHPLDDDSDFKPMKKSSYIYEHLDSKSLESIITDDIGADISNNESSSSNVSNPSPFKKRDKSFSRNIRLKN